MSFVITHVWCRGVLWWHIWSYLAVVKNPLINSTRVEIRNAIQIILEEHRATAITLRVKKSSKLVRQFLNYASGKWKQTKCITLALLSGVKVILILLLLLIILCYNSPFKNLSLFANGRSQFLLDRLGRCLKLFVSTERTFSHELASQFDLDIFLYAKYAHVARACVYLNEPATGHWSPATGRKVALTASRMGASDPSNSDNLNGNSGGCACVHTCVRACVFDMLAIYDNNIWPKLTMIIIKIIILYLIQITHTDDFPSTVTTGVRLVIKDHWHYLGCGPSSNKEDAKATLDQIRLLLNWLANANHKQEIFMEITIVFASKL